MAFTSLNRKLARQDQYLRRNSSKKRNWKKIIFRTLIVLVILFIVIYLPLWNAGRAARKIVSEGRLMNEAVKNENLDEIKTHVTEIKKATGSLNTSLNFLFWVRIIPYIGSFYADAKHFAKAGEYELTAAETIVEELLPYKAELGFNGTPTPGTDRVAQAVKVLEKTLPLLDKVEPELKKAREEVSSIDVGKYPEKFGTRNIRSLVDTAKNFIIGAHVAVTEAKPALEVAPAALGQPSAKNYLMIFQNDKELRPTGGFMTAYAFLGLDKGRVSSSQSDDIYRLDEQLLITCQTKICPLTPPDPIVKYLPEANGKPRTAWSMRDSNLSPDVPTSIAQFERMYNLLGKGMPWDGIILIDTHVVEELIKITGPIEVFGTRYSADHDDRCNCPNVIYELENYAQVIEKGEQDRKAILGTLMQQILARSLGASTEKLPEFINAGVKLANSKHIIFNMHDQKTQAALDQLDWTGRIKPYTFDYLHINDSNFAGGKSNLYVEQKVVLDINIGNDGKVTDKLSITYNNPQKYDAWLNQRNRDYLRIYVPKGSKLLSNKGSDVKVTTIEDELGKTVFEAFLEIRPQNSRTIEFEYELPQTFTGNEYNLLIQKQPGKPAFEYEIKVNGRTKERFELITDKDLKFAI